MAKIIDYDFRKGSITNKGSATTTETLTGATLQKSEKGISFVSTQDGANILQINTTLSGTYSVELAVRVDSVAAHSGYLFDARHTGGTGYLYTSTYTVLSASAGTIYRDGIARNTLPPLNTWMHIVVTGISIVCTRLMFNSNSSAGQGCIGKYAFFRIYEGTLTAQEVAKLYEDYLNPTIEGKPKRGFLMNKPNDLSSEVNKTLGSNTLTNPTFTTWSGSNPNQTPNGWSIVNTGASNYFQEGVSGGARCLLASGTSAKMYQLNKIPVGKCKIIINTTVTSGVLSIEETNDGTVLGTISASGNTVIEYTATTLNGIRFGRSSGTVDITINSFYIYPLSGLVAAYNMKPNGLTLTDISGNGYNLSIVGNTTGAVVNNDGLKLPGTAGLSRTQLSQIKQAGDYTVHCRVRFNALGGVGLVWGNGNSSSDRNGLVVNSAGVISFEKYNGSAYSGKIGSGLAVNTWYNVTCINTGGTHTLYVDTVEQTSTSTLNELGNTAQEFNVGIDLSNGTGNRNADIDIADLRVYNRALSLQEVKDYNNQFAKQPYLVEDFSDAPADGNSIVPRDWQKISGSWKVGELSLTSGELVTNGGFDTDTTWSKDTGITISDGTANFNTSGDGGLYKSITALVVGKTYRATYKIISITSGTLFFRLGVNEFIGTSRTSAGIYTETFTYRGIGTGTNRCEIRASGATTAVVDDFSIVEIDPLPTLTKGSKYLECVTEGNLGIPCNQSYGTWEFDLYTTGTTQPFIHFTANNLNTYGGAGFTGYMMFFYSDGRIDLTRSNSGGSGSNLFRTATTGYVKNTWYRIKITRSTAGVFTVLMKGGALTPTAGYDGYTLITPASGTNPVTDTTYTSSQYLVLELDAGDRIANIKLTQGVQA